MRAAEAKLASSCDMAEGRLMPIARRYLIRSEGHDGKAGAWMVDGSEGKGEVGFSSI